jgi:Tfp pilus assembly protein PilX
LNKKGVALYLVLMVLTVVIIFANTLLNLVSSQNSLNIHQAKRIQAFYAAQAGINYALEALRLNDTNWTVPTTGNITHYFCPSNTTDFPCNSSTLTVIEPNLPLASISYIEVVVGPTINGSRQVRAAVNYSQ